MKKILVVDPVQSNIDTIKNILSRSYFLILTASSAEEALTTHEREKADLIIVDLDVPGIGGDELCSAIRRDRRLRDVSIIITCPDSLTARRRCATCGANFRIERPIDPHLLFHTVNKLLNISGRERLRLLVRVFANGVPDYFFSTTENISATGMLIETDRTLSRGDKVKCSFYLGPDHIVTEGEVVRVTTKTSQVTQYGMRFIDFDHYSIKALESYVRRQRSR